MADSSTHQQTSGQSASSTTHNTHRERRVTVQPKVKSQKLPTTSTTVTVIMWLLSAELLVALVVALVAVGINQKQVPDLTEENHSLQEKTRELQTMLATLQQTSAEVISSDAMNIDHMSSCADIHTHLSDAASGVYMIYPGGRRPGRSVWCDMETDGGGWTRVQYRRDGSMSFSKTWEVYQEGFGSPQGEFWLGNDDLHRLTTAQPSELRIDLWDWDGTHGYAKYSTFSVGDSRTNYKLHVATYIGDIGDALSDHGSAQFSSMDRDNDESYDNCAEYGGGGGWWYHSCGYANLNGRYYVRGGENVKGINWPEWRRDAPHYSYKEAAMLTRPRQKLIIP